MLGIIYEQGLGVPVNHKTSFEWYLKAAKQGIPTAQHDVGVKYFQGQGVTQDYGNAAFWWEQSASTGLADSQFNLGLLNYRGMGMEQNYTVAAELFEKAAVQGHASAQYSLAVMYAFGQGVKQDDEKAFNWFKQSADQGVPQAQFNLGVYYENGTFVQQDQDTAKRWYQQAAAQGLVEASQRLKQLETQSPSEKVAVDTQIDQKVAHPKAEKITSDTSLNIDIKREDWVLSQHPDDYTLQLSSVLKEQDIIKFIKNSQLEGDIAYIEVIVKGVKRYAAIYGVYNTYDQAKKSINDLPTHLQKGNPWVRNFGIIQELINKSAG